MLKRWKNVCHVAHRSNSEFHPKLRGERGTTLAIENAFHDLNAVNPDRINTGDQRTPLELLTVISEQGREADAALKRLQNIIIK
jgi:hypothetical protein